MVDHTLPTGRWAFDAAVADVFDDMLKRSIPQYEVMREAVFRLACRYARDRTAVVDLGCSRGEALAPLVERFGARCRFVGVDVSGPMLDAARERFDGYTRCGVVSVRALDLRTDHPADTASVTLAVLTLQFVPIEYRQAIARRVWDRTAPGGAFLVVEKVLGDTAALDAAMVEEYLRLKSEHGYSPEEIERKRLSLEGVLVPLTARWNEEMLRRAGFSEVECFWRWMNFAGWVAVRG
jgi:tRNA (cmo5U34)-methyltransferase